MSRNVLTEWSCSLLVLTMDARNATKLRQARLNDGCRRVEPADHRGDRSHAAKTSSADPNAYAAPPDFVRTAGAEQPGGAEDSSAEGRYTKEAAFCKAGVRQADDEADDAPDDASDAANDAAGRPVWRRRDAPVRANEPWNGGANAAGSRVRSRRRRATWGAEGRQ